MTPLDSSVLCTVEKRRRLMWHLVILVVLLAAALPSARPATAGGTTTPSMNVAAVVDAKVNINTADVKELMKLQGVGRSLAEKIVQYRDAHGLFRKAGDLRKVEGVGAALWEKNRERVVVK
jgi:competence protein ComEA